MAKRTAKNPRQRKLLIPKPGVDYQLDLPKGHLSFSQISLYWQCPMKYAARYVLGIKDEPSLAMLEGSVMSRCLELVAKARFITGQHLDFDGVMAAWDSASNDLKQADTTTLEFQAIRARSLDFLTTFHQEQCVEDDLVPEGIPSRIGHNSKPHIEVEHKIDIAGVPVILIPDIVEKDRVTDYKVAKSARYYDAETSLQLSLYAVAFKKTRVRYIVFQKEPTKTGPNKDLVVYRSATRGLKRTKKEVKLTVLTTAHAISKKAFPLCEPGQWFCSSNWCSYWSKCRGK